MNARTHDQLPTVHRFAHKFNIRRLQQQAIQLAHEPGFINFTQQPGVDPTHEDSRGIGNPNTAIATESNLGVQEHLYTQPTAQYRNTYFHEVVTQFQSPAVRVRLVRHHPGTHIRPHTDFDPTYAVRVIVPIFADTQVINHFWRNTHQESYHLPADGSAYFLNIRWRHAVTIAGPTPRIVLMFSLQDQQALAEIPQGHTASNVPQVDAQYT